MSSRTRDVAGLGHFVVRAPLDQSLLEYGSDAVPARVDPCAMSLVTCSRYLAKPDPPFLAVPAIVRAGKCKRVSL